MQITKREVKGNLIKQKLIGIAILALCSTAAYLASKGTTPDEKDIGIAIFLAPLGIYMLFTKNKVID